MTKIGVIKCDQPVLCYNDHGRMIIDHDEYISAIKVAPFSKCLECGTDIKNIYFACMRTSIIISHETVTFCLIRSTCKLCCHMDWFRPDPEMTCGQCGYSVRFNFPTSNWARPWECNRWR